MNHFYRRVTFGLIFCTMSFSLHAFSLFFQAPECVTYDPFEALIGMSEQQFFSKYGFSDAGKEFLRKKLQNKQGEFYVKGVEPFKADSSHKGFQDVSLEFPYTFSVVEGGENPTGKSFQKKVDVAALQALRANNGAVFQVASNLNCLESSGSKNEKISHYYGCRAQGQMSVLSALPGIIDRMYLQPSINLLAYFNWNGSIAYTSGKFPQVTDIDIRFKGMTAQDIQKAAETMSVGVQKNVCVTSGLREFASYGMFKATPVKGTDQRITQVFTAALDPYANDSATPGFENLARIALHGAYKGTFDVVRELQAKKLYLTLVGGGVFQNKFEWIAEAIDAAFHEFCFRELVGFFGRHEMKPSYEKTEVTLVLYYISPDQKATADWQKAKQILKQLVAKSKGTWTRYTSVGVEKVVEN